MWQLLLICGYRSTEKKRFHFSFFKKIPYLRNSNNGFDLFYKFHKKLVREGYKIITISDLYEIIKNKKK